MPRWIALNVIYPGGWEMPDTQNYMVRASKDPTEDVDLLLETTNVFSAPLLRRLAGAARKETNPGGHSAIYLVQADSDGMEVKVDMVNWLGTVQTSWAERDDPYKAIDKIERDKDHKISLGMEWCEPENYE